jgi:hypothetical protein
MRNFNQEPQEDRYAEADYELKNSLDILLLRAKDEPLARRAYYQIERQDDVFEIFLENLEEDFPDIIPKLGDQLPLPALPDIPSAPFMITHPPTHAYVTAEDWTYEIDGQLTNRRALAINLIYFDEQAFEQNIADSAEVTLRLVEGERRLRRENRLAGIPGHTEEDEYPLDPESMSNFVEIATGFISEYDDAFMEKIVYVRKETGEEYVYSTQDESHISTLTGLTIDKALFDEGDFDEDPHLVLLDLFDIRWMRSEG